MWDLSMCGWELVEIEWSNVIAQIMIFLSGTFWDALVWDLFNSEISKG